MSHQTPPASPPPTDADETGAAKPPATFHFGQLDLRGAQGAIIGASGPVNQTFTAGPASADTPADQADRPPDPLALSLYRVLSGNDAFTDDDLQDICFTLGVDWDSLSGSAKPAKARALVTRLAHQHRLAELRDAVRERRPHLEV